MNNENIEIITPKELIKNITKTNTKDDYQQYDNFFTNIDIDKHRELYRKLYKELGSNNFYDKLKELFNSKIYFWKDKYKFQKELLNELSIFNFWDSNKLWNVILWDKGKKEKSLMNIIFKKIWNYLDKLLSPVLLPFLIYQENKENLFDWKSIYLYDDNAKYLIKYFYIKSYIPFLWKKIIKNLYEINKKNITKNLSDIVENKLYTWLLKILLKKDLDIINCIKKDLDIEKIFYFNRESKEKSFVLNDNKIKEKLRLIKILIPFIQKNELKKFIEGNNEIFDELYNKETQLVQEILIKLNKRFSNPFILILWKREIKYYDEIFIDYELWTKEINKIEIYKSYFFLLSLIFDKRFIYSKFSFRYFFYWRKEGLYDFFNKKDFLSNTSYFNKFNNKHKFIFHYLLDKTEYIKKEWEYYLNIENSEFYNKQNILNILKKIIHIDYEYIKTNSYWKKTYKDRIYWLLKWSSVKDFELAIDFLVETLKIDTDFIDIYEIISIINEWNQDKTNWLLKLFSAIIQKDYDFFKDNFLKHFYKLEITIKNSKDIIKLIEISSKKSLDDVFDMIFGSETWFTEEKEKISIFIKEYNSWSCLLSWYRWVWKSTLIKSLIEKINNNSENNTKYIPITINIPEQKKDENWGLKTFSKKDLMNKVIQQTYLKLKNEWFSSKQLESLQDQYVRTFKQVEEISWYVKLTKRFWLIRTVIEVLKFSLPVWFWLLSQVLLSKLNISIFWFKIENIISNPDKWQVLIAWILIILNYLIFRTILNVNYNAKLERLLYNEDIAEDNFTKNLEELSLKSKINLFFSKVYEYKYLIFIVTSISYILIYFITKHIGKINEFLLKISVKISEVSKKIFELYNDNVFVWNFLIFITIIWVLLWISYIVKKYFSKNKKFIIIIDELDKLLDFDKINKNENKEKISSMKDIFEILGKLKTLFFEAENILFFVVSNKEAYDYYLSNKFQEDDMISNIFNKIIYLPMNDMNQFNLNFKVDIKPKLDNDLKQKIKKYIYFKSHGNWRKANFILWNAIESTFEENKIEKVRMSLWSFKKFEDEYKFHEFFDNLYQVFEKWSLDNLNNKIFEDFLFSMSHKKSWYIRDLLKVKLNQINKDIDKVNEETFYTSYLSNLQNVIKELYSNNANSVLNINDYKRINDEEEFFWYYFSSILKISNNYAYRDYILNYLLNIFENINNFKKINLIQIFKNLKIDENDLDYPVFIDLIILWTPLMLIYFNNIEINE